VNRNATSALVLAVLITAAVIALPPRASGQATSDTVPAITLAEARRRAVSIDPDVVSARGRLQTASWQRRAALADMFAPRLTAGGNYTHFSEPFFNFGTGAVSPNATSATIEASYVLLGAGKFGELKSSRASVESAEANETAARFRTSLATDAAYFAVLADRELSRVAAERRRRAEEQFGIARVRVLAGEAISSDSLQLLLELNRARLAILSRDSALAASRFRLGRRVGVAGPVDAAPIDTAVPPLLPMTQEQAIAEVRERGPEVEAARAAERGANAVVGAERERYLPEIRVAATAGAYDAELFPSAMKRSQIAVNVALPIWNGGQRELAVARARADRNTARALRADREREAGELTSQAYHGYLTSRAGIELALVGVAVSRENYRVQRARYREGATTILDLLEAQVALSESEATLVQARYSTRLALAQIEALLGRRIFAAPGTDPD
jgi:outer membrane protein TolC